MHATTRTFRQTLVTVAPVVALLAALATQAVGPASTAFDAAAPDDTAVSALRVDRDAVTLNRNTGARWA